MLYVSTRNTTDSYTAYRVLHEDYAPDGGLFAPYRLPIFSSEEHKVFRGKTFGERVAKTLNIFFPVALSGWDVDFAIGRYPYKLTSMNHRLYIAELWHNLDGDFTFIENSLYEKLCEDEHSRKRPSHWARIAIRISFLSAICCELVILNVSSMDFASIAGDYLFVIAAWYVRKMGFSIDKIICTSDEIGGAWDIFQKGTISTSNKCCFEKDMKVPNDCRPFLELLIYENLGV